MRFASILLLLSLVNVLVGTTDAAVVPPDPRVPGQIADSRVLECAVGPESDLGGPIDPGSADVVSACSDSVAWVGVLTRVGRMIQFVWRSRLGQAAVRTVGGILRELGIRLVAREIINYLDGDTVGASDRRTLEELLAFTRDLEASIRRNADDIASIRREMERQHGYTEAALGRLNDRITSLDRRISDAEVRIQDLIRQGRATRAQLDALRRTLVDHDNRILVLEDAVMDHEGRIVTLEGRILSVEQFAQENRDRIEILEDQVADNTRRLNRDDYYNKHVFGIGGQLLYSNAVSTGHEGMLGAAFGVNYLFNSFFGIFAQGAFTPVRLTSFGIIMRSMPVPS